MIKGFLAISLSWAIVHPKTGKLANACDTGNQARQIKPKDSRVRFECRPCRRHSSVSDWANAITIDLDAAARRVRDNSLENCHEVLR